MKPLLQKTVASIRRLRREPGVSLMHGWREKQGKTISTLVHRVQEIPWRRVPVAQYLKYLSMALAGLTLVILILGLIFMPRYEFGTENADGKSAAASSGDGTSSQGGSALTLVDAVKKYSDRFTPPPPPKPLVKNNTAPGDKPAELAPPPPPPDPKPPAPTFRLEGTVMIGETVGIAWIVLQGKNEAEAFFPGEVIQKYTLQRVESGQAFFERDGYDYSLKVPEVKKPALTAGAPAPSPSEPAKDKKDPRTQTPPRPPGTPERPSRRPREPLPQP